MFKTLIHFCKIICFTFKGIADPEITSSTHSHVVCMLIFIIHGSSVIVESLILINILNFIFSYFINCLVKV